MPKTVLAIGPHADDLTIFAGGLLKKFSSEGNKLICVRICDDWEDAVGITKEEAIKRNRFECDKAYKRLGAEEIVHMDYSSDYLAGEDYIELRGKIVRLIRKYKPNIVVSFDLNGINEENRDHTITAQAVNEACWQASFDLLYPEHFEEGFEIHAVGERYLFARNPTVINCRMDISKYIRYKIEALCEHKTVLKNFFHQYKLLARANNLNVKILEEDVPNEVRVKLFVRTVFGKIGKEFGAKFGEVFNKIDAGLLKEIASND